MRLSNFYMFYWPFERPLLWDAGSSFLPIKKKSRSYWFLWSSLYFPDTGPLLDTCVAGIFLCHGLHFNLVMLFPWWIEIFNLNEFQFINLFRLVLFVLFKKFFLASEVMKIFSCVNKSLFVLHFTLRSITFLEMNFVLCERGIKMIFIYLNILLTQHYL